MSSFSQKGCASREGCQEPLVGPELGSDCGLQRADSAAVVAGPIAIAHQCHTLEGLRHNSLQFTSHVHHKAHNLLPPPHEMAPHRQTAAGFDGCHGRRSHTLLMAAPLAYRTEDSCWNANKIVSNPLRHRRMRGSRPGDYTIREAAFCVSNPLPIIPVFRILAAESGFPGGTYCTGYPFGQSLEGTTS